MVTIEAITQAAKNLANTSQPNKIILFGSYARGNQGNHSDLDMLVIQEKKSSDLAIETIKLKKTLRILGVPIDLLIIDQEQFDEKKSIPGTVYYWANKEGVTLYDSAKAVLTVV